MKRSNTKLEKIIERRKTLQKTKVLFRLFEILLLLAKKLFLNNKQYFPDNIFFYNLIQIHKTCEYKFLETFVLLF